MKALLWFLALFAVAVGVSLGARYNEGYVLLVVPPYRVELSLNMAILLVFGAFLLFHGLLRALSLALSLPRRARRYREQQQKSKRAARENADRLPDQ